MGLLSRTPEEQAAADDRKQAKAEQKAEKAEQFWAKMNEQGQREGAKKNIDTEGALATLHCRVGQKQFGLFILFPDRVELHKSNTLEFERIMARGAGVESMLMRNVTSVDCASTGIFSQIRIHGSGHSIEFEAAADIAQRIRLEVQEAAAAASLGGAPSRNGESVGFTPPAPLVPPGWYVVDTHLQRYWDGSGWTEHTAPVAPTPPA